MGIFLSRLYLKDVWQLQQLGAIAPIGLTNTRLRGLLLVQIKLQTHNALFAQSRLYPE